MTFATTNTVVQEMNAVFAAVQVGSIGKEPLKVRTPSGRQYEVCYARETSPDVWQSTHGMLVRGYFRCSDCPKVDSDIPGGNWFQFTLKNGASPEPTVRLFEIGHRFKFHPQTLAELATQEKCVNVFGSTL